MLYIYHPKMNFCMKKIYLLLIFIGLVCFSFSSGIQAQSNSIQKESSKIEKIEGISIYPNPATGDKLSITSTKNLTKTISIFTVLGEKVMFKVLIGRELDISSLPPAVYVIRIKEGEQKATLKFVRG
ncbi:T9SS C-terminal target domain-containing protein [Aquimarina muelleri]|uniref:T9SS C-terminal target domain-containing protein n=2 Tax=Aquimarina muelleri TaxID=279356 RepID=A0A918N233_9FLAO|nr:T9SS C-terminal target domain-containing protein [Aquimarina muelleri]